MNKKFIIKSIIFGIIILFIGINVTPSLNGYSALRGNNFNYDNPQIRYNEPESTGNFKNRWWPMFQHDLSHTGYSISDAPETNNLKWSFNANGGQGSSPAVIDNKVYVGLDFDLYCLDADNGSEIWTNRVISPDGTPAVVNDRVYTPGNNCYCLDADDGTIIWTYDPGSYSLLSSPAVINGKVYIGYDDNKMYCLDADDGTKIWSYSTGGNVRSSPAVINGKVYIGCDDNKVYCLDADDGTKIWSYSTGLPVSSSPAVVSGKVYIGSNSGNLYCLDAEKGDEIWSFQTEGANIRSSPAVAYGKVYFTAGDAHVYCLDGNTGQEIWNYDATCGMHKSVAVADGKVYVPTIYLSYPSYKEYIECLDADTGEKIWSYRISGRGSAPAIAKGNVYISSGNGKIYCFGSPVKKTAFMIGNIKNVIKNMREGVLFEAVNVRCLQFLPLRYVHLTDNEQIKVSDKYLGILTDKFIFGIFYVR